MMQISFPKPFGVYKLDVVYEVYKVYMMLLFSTFFFGGWGGGGGGRGGGRYQVDRISVVHGVDMVYEV